MKKGVWVLFLVLPSVIAEREMLMVSFWTLLGLLVAAVVGGTIYHRTEKYKKSIISVIGLLLGLFLFLVLSGVGMELI